MGKPWCAHLPVVTVDRSAVPKPVTMIVPYYESPRFFARQVQHWSDYPSNLSEYLSVIVVDDGSPTPAVRVPWIRQFRIEDDIRWNWLAARNIGAHEARDGWLLLTDMDHVVPVETLESVIYGVHRIDTIYGFSRVEHTGEPLAPHPNSWVLTRAMFWHVGGYDETLSGHYGTDGDWRRRCAAAAPMAILSDSLVRHEFVGDSSTTAYKRKQPEDARVSRLIRQRKPGWTPKTLSYAYHEVRAVQEVA